jgi:hypothetical protein
MPEDSPLAHEASPEPSGELWVKHFTVHVYAWDVIQIIAQQVATCPGRR